MFVAVAVINEHMDLFVQSVFISDLLEQCIGM